MSLIFNYYIGLGIVIIHNIACTFANVTWDMSSAECTHPAPLRSPSSANPDY